MLTINDEVVAIILTFIAEPHSLCVAGASCQAFLNSTRQSDLWKQIVIARWPRFAFHSQVQNYRALYLGSIQQRYWASESAACSSLIRLVDDNSVAVKVYDDDWNSTVLGAEIMRTPGQFYTEFAWSPGDDICGSFYLGVAADSYDVCVAGGCGAKNTSQGCGLSLASGCIWYDGHQQPAQHALCCRPSEPVGVFVDLSAGKVDVRFSVHGQKPTGVAHVDHTRLRPPVRFAADLGCEDDAVRFHPERSLWCERAARWAADLGLADDAVRWGRW